MNFVFICRFCSLPFWLFFGSEVSTTSANILSRPLRISTRHFTPYMYQDGQGNFYKGMEFEFLQRMAEMLNVSLQFQASSNRSDICYDVAMNIADICIGGIFPTENVLQYTLMSAAYATDDLTWCVQKAEMMPRSFVMFHLAQPMPWFLVIFGYGYTSGFLLYLLIQFDLKYKRRNNCDWHQATWFVVLPAVIGHSPNFQPLKGTVRIFFAVILITAFFLFQIVFFRLHYFLNLRKPLHQVASFDEIMDDDFHLVGSQEAFNLLSRNEIIPNSKLESFYVCADISECLVYEPNLKNLAIGGSRLNMLHSPSFFPSHTFCFDVLENIVSYPIALYMRKDFVLEKKVNEIVQQLLETGFFEQWKRDSQIEREKPESPYTYQVPLSISHMSAALMFIGVAAVVSTSTFAVENFVYRKMKRQRGNRQYIWMYLEQFFDGRRHYLKNVPERLQEQNENFEKPFPYLD